MEKVQFLLCICVGLETMCFAMWIFLMLNEYTRGWGTTTWHHHLQPHAIKSQPRSTHTQSYQGPITRLEKVISLALQTDTLLSCPALSFIRPTLGAAHWVHTVVCKWVVEGGDHPVWVTLPRSLSLTSYCEACLMAPVAVVKANGATVHPSRIMPSSCC